MKRFRNDSFLFPLAKGDRSKNKFCFHRNPPLSWEILVKRMSNPAVSHY
jgi:hypothetical protein